MLDGMDYISKVVGPSSGFKTFEAHYSTRSGPSLSVFTRRDSGGQPGERGAAVQTEGGTIRMATAVPETRQFEQLRGMIATAYALLDDASKGKAGSAGP